MRENNIMNQIGAIFGAFMTIFYIGVGLYLLLNDGLDYIDKFLRTLVGGTFTVYGIYRGYRSVVMIRDAFFGKTENED